MRTFMNKVFILCICVALTSQIHNVQSQEFISPRLQYGTGIEGAINKYYFIMVVCSILFNIFKNQNVGISLPTINIIIIIQQNRPRIASRFVGPVLGFIPHELRKKTSNINIYK